MEGVAAMDGAVDLSLVGRRASPSCYSGCYAPSYAPLAPALWRSVFSVWRARAGRRWRLAEREAPRPPLARHIVPPSLYVRLLLISVVRPPWQALVLSPSQLTFTSLLSSCPVRLAVPSSPAARSPSPPAALRKTLPPPVPFRQLPTTPLLPFLISQCLTPSTRLTSSVVPPVVRNSPFVRSSLDLCSDDQRPGQGRPGCLGSLPLLLELSDQDLPLLCSLRPLPHPGEPPCSRRQPTHEACLSCRALPHLLYGLLPLPSRALLIRAEGASGEEELANESCSGVPARQALHSVS